MGMYDSFFFAKGTLPNDKSADKEEFQTKDLECNLDKYYVDKNNNVTKKEFGSEETSMAQDLEAKTYSYNFIYDSEQLFTRKLLRTEYQEYKIKVKNGRLIEAIKIAESGFEPPDRDK